MSRGLPWILLLLIFGVMLYLLLQQRGEIAELHAQRSALQTAVESLQAKSARDEVTLQLREKQLDAMRSESSRLRNELRSLQRVDQSVRDWSDTGLPDAVIGLLQGGAGSGGSEGDAAGASAHSGSLP